MARKESVWITRDTGSSFVKIWLANKGVRKEAGCTEYLSPDKNDTSLITILYETECIARYGSCPKGGEAWFVEWKNNDWLWTRYDHLYKYGEILV